MLFLWIDIRPTYLSVRTRRIVADPAAPSNVSRTCFKTRVHTLLVHSPLLRGMDSPLPPRRPLQGKVAVVTGSSRSIGASIARRLAADGADVIVNYHRIAVEAERTAYSINSKDGGRAYIVRADVSTIDGGRFLLQECVRLVGPPDILVLNAGLMGHKPLADTDEKEFDAHINTNIKGPLFMVQAAAKIMKPGTHRLAAL